MSKSKGRRLAEWLRNLDSDSRASSNTLADDSVTSAKIADDAVINAKIADGAVHTANLADTGVTFAKLHTALVVTESDAIGSNDNDTTIATSAAIKDYVDTQVAGKDNTDEITEGSTNLYFTNERVDDRVNSLLTAGTGITLTYNDAANTLTVAGAAQYGDSDVGSYLSANGYATQSTIVAAITDSAPTTLDTLNELAAALGDDANFSTTVTNSIAAKVPLAGGSMTGQLVIDDGNANPLELKRSSQVGIEFNDTSTGSRYLGVNSGNLYYGSNLNHANNNRVLTTGDEGSGNGLDADTLDGSHASAFATLSGATFTGDIIANGLEVGTAYGSDSQYLGIKRSAASSNDYILIQGSSSDAGATYLSAGSGSNVHIRASANSSTNQLVVTTSGTTIGGNTVWHAGNDGSGSGLDADTLDGVQGSSYLRSDTSDTFTGNLTIASGSLTLPAGYNLQWGSGYNSGNSAIWADGTANIIRMAPTGNSSGKTFELKATENISYTPLLIDADWGTGSYSEALTIYGTYPSYALRSTTSNSTFLQHIDVNGNLTWYFDTTGNTGTSWTKKAHLTPAGVFYIGSSGADTVWSSGNDGSGSGLDADTVDGIQGSNLLTLSGSQTITGVKTFSAASGNVLLLNDTNATNATNANIYFYFQAQGSNLGYIGYGSGSTNYLYVNNPSAPIYLAGSSCLVRGGYEVWGTDNDGSGSGLDADTLDGQHGSYYVSRTFENTSRNLVIPTSSTSGSAGLAMETSSGAFMFQLYGTGTQYGFLDAQWGGWDIKKTAGGQMELRVSGTDYTVYHTGNLTNNNQLTNGAGYITNGSNYNVNNVWLRENGDNAHVQLYGNSRQMVFRTDGTTEYSSGVGAYPFAWMYGGNAASNRRMLLDSNGSLWTNSQATLWGASNDGSGSGLDADTVDGIQGASLLRSDADDDMAGKIIFSQGSSNRDRGIVGQYSPTSIAAIWAMGTSYQIAANGSTAGTLYGLCYSYQPNYGGTGTNPGAITGLGHQMTWRANGATQTSIGTGVYTIGNITAYSDRRVKTNIEVIPNALEKVQKLSGYTFDRTDIQTDPESDTPETFRQTGLIAQEVLEVLPEAVTGTEDLGYGVAYGNMVGLLIEAIKEQQAQIEELKEKIKCQ